MSYTEVPEHLSSAVRCGEDDDVSGVGYSCFGFENGLGFGSADNSAIDGSDEYAGYTDELLHYEIENIDCSIGHEQGTLSCGIGWDIS